MNAPPSAEPHTAADLAPGATPSELHCTGAWVLRELPRLEPRREALAAAAGDLVIEASGVTTMDTAGAWLLHRTVRALQARGRAVRHSAQLPMPAHPT